MIVVTEKVLREADGPTEARGPEASNAWWVERCSLRGAPQNRTVRAGRSPMNTSAGATVHFASLMDICHLKSAELEAKHQKYKRSSCTPR